MLGGNKSLLFNVEQIIKIAGPVRLILFYDAGQVRDVGRAVRLEGDICHGRSRRPPFSCDDPFVDPTAARSRSSRDRQSAASAFKTSTGAEVRFFMPVLNVPFRLIFAYNPQRGGVLDNTLQPQKAFQFRFAVGTTFYGLNARLLEGTDENASMRAVRPCHQCRRCRLGALTVRRLRQQRDHEHTDVHAGVRLARGNRGSLLGHADLERRGDVSLHGHGERPVIRPADRHCAAGQHNVMAPASGPGTAAVPDRAVQRHAFRAGR